jgi:phage major head subunit gpT-like protein
MATSLSNKIESLQNAINASLLESLTKPPATSVYNQIATVIPTTAKSTVLPIGLPIQDMSEQTPESMTASGIDNDQIAVTVKSYMTGFKLSLDDLNDNSTEAVVDLYTPRLRELTNKAVKFYDKLIIDYIVSNPTTFTGEALFANSQTWGRGATAQDNLLGLALSDTNLITALGTIKTFKDHLGQVISQSGQINLVVPPQLEYTAKQLVANTTTTYGGQNVLAGVANVVVSEYLTDTNDWYLTVGKDQLLLVERMAPEVKIVQNDEMETVLCNVKLRAAPAVGCWSSFVKSVQ